MVILMAGFSYLIGQKAVQPIWQSSMSIALSPSDIEGNAETSPGQWMVEFMEQTLLSEAVLAETLNQLDQRDLRLFNSPGELRNHFQQYLEVTGTPQRVALTYQSTSKEHVASVLEAYGRALLGYQMAQDQAAGVEGTAQIVSAAARNSNPLNDVESESLRIAGTAFGIFVGAALLLALLMRLLLGKSKRVFDPEATPALQTLDKPSTWSPLTAAQDAEEQDQAQDDD